MFTSITIPDLLKTPRKYESEVYCNGVFEDSNQKENNGSRTKIPLLVCGHEIKSLWWCICMAGHLYGDTSDPSSAVS